MGRIIKISAKSNLKEIEIALQKLVKNRMKGKKKLADFYGKMPGIYGNGIEYQKKIRGEWRNF